MNIINKTDTHKAETSGTVVIPTKSNAERAWRNSELIRTDFLVMLPDYPRDGTNLIAYRAALADYPAQPGFPDSVRPKQSDYKV